MDICSFLTTQQYYNGIPVRYRQDEQQSLALVDLSLIEQAIEHNEPQLLQQLLAPAEQDYFQRFKYMKRKKEWLGGRIAAKAALLAPWTSLPDYMQALSSITVLPNKHGRPLIQELPVCLVAKKGKPVISISHSDDFAMALVRPRGSCGLDLQKISTKLAGLSSHFATDAELHRLAEQAGCDEDTRLTMLWTTKEALKKAVLHDQSVIFSETELQEVTRINESVNESLWRFTCTVQGQLQSVLVYLLPPYILSITEDC
uniref:4'-phosphopantetheinyl transferase family protein n=1 Tax=Candidatus Electrothrix sp. TaxID=2170559 RepID=UPI0040570F7E